MAVLTIAVNKREKCFRGTERRNGFITAVKPDSGNPETTVADKSADHMNTLHGRGVDIRSPLKPGRHSLCPEQRIKRRCSFMIQRIGERAFLLRSQHENPYFMATPHSQTELSSYRTFPVEIFDLKGNKTETGKIPVFSVFRNQHKIGPRIRSCPELGGHSAGGICGDRDLLLPRNLQIFTVPADLLLRRKRNRRREKQKKRTNNPYTFH